MPSIFVKIPETLCETIRLDQYIASIPQGMNRSKLKSTAQEILLNGKNAKLSSKVKKSISPDGDAGSMLSPLSRHFFPKITN